jgi:hypothetical protein
MDIESTSLSLGFRNWYAENMRKDRPTKIKLIAKGSGDGDVYRIDARDTDAWCEVQQWMYERMGEPPNWAFTHSSSTPYRTFVNIPSPAVWMVFRLRWCTSA